jgi:MoxR-like ATPase
MYMTWELYHGDREAHDVTLPDPPPWRRFPIRGADQGGDPTFIPTPEVVRAVNAALYLRRPLLISGPPGSGKSSVAESVAHELRLGRVLRWHVTSHSTLEEAMYRYDALGRLQHNQLHPGQDDITGFLRLGPLGTALLGREKPRVMLIDELDKGELDLPGDLLNVLERGEYEIAELNRLDEDTVSVREVDSDDMHPITRGRIRCSLFPFIVMTSNGEREFPGPFLRRCIRVNLDLPDEERLVKIVTTHFNDPSVAEGERELIRAFAERIRSAPNRQVSLAVDQLLNATFLVTRLNAPTGAERDKLIELVQRELDRT